MKDGQNRTTRVTARFGRGIESMPEAREIRVRVFIREQGFRNEFDELDRTAWTLVLYADGRPAATGRVFPCADDAAAHTGLPEDREADTWVLGRIAVLPEFRGLGLGRLVVERLEEQAAGQGAGYAWLHAQMHAQGFYENCGYRVVGGVEMEEHCPHVAMQKTLGSGPRCPD